jgi:hypothetical protein
LSLPSGIVTTSDVGTVTSAMIADDSISDADIKSTANIAATKVQGTIPSGGATGQALVKNSGTNYDAVWGTIAGAVYQTTAPSTPSVGQVWVDSDAAGSTLNQNDYVLISAIQGYVEQYAPKPLDSFLLMGA